MTVTDEMVRAARRKAPKFWRDYADSEEQMRQVLTAALAAMWRDIKNAPKDGRRLLAIYGGQTRVIQYGKTSHVPLYGFCLADQGIEDFDLVPDESLKGWTHLPAPPATEVEIQTRPQKDESR